MHKIFGFFIFIAMVINANSQSVSVLNGTNDFQIIKSDINGLTLKMEFNNLQFDRAKVVEGEFYRLIADNFIPSMVEGQPELPIFNRLFELPADADVQIEILGKKEVIIDLNTLGISFPVFPHQPSAIKIEGNKPSFVMDKSTYQTNDFYAQPLLQANYIGQMRQTRMARLSIAPLSYNPVTKQIKIVTEIVFELHFRNGDLAKTITEKQNYYAQAFNMVSSSTINSQIFSIIPPVSAQIAERMVIISDSNNRQTLMPFVNMKEHQGFDVHLAFTQNPAVGNSLTSIKNYLISLYNNSSTAPTYAILVGDVAQIPAFVGQAASNHFTDLNYFEYTNDDFPEVFYGRFSCSDTTELHNIISKTLEYEQYLMPNSDYLDTSVLIAGYDNTYGPTHGNGQVNYGSNYYYNLSNGIQPLLYLYPASASQAVQIRADASRGVALLNYSAHGNFDGWDNPSFKNANVAAMTNEHKYPVMIGNACLTGKFDMNDCFGEVLTNAANKGAVGYIGASNNTLWDEDFYWAVGYGNVSANPSFAGTGPGVFDRVFHTHNEPFSQWSLSLSQIIAAGNLAVTQSGSSEISYYWEVYHCFGDPSLVHYMKKPSLLNPTFNQLLPIGSNVLAVNSVPYALVALSNADTLIASAYADSLGAAVLNFSAFTQQNQALLTISAQNKAPFSSTISVLTPNAPYLHFISYDLNDSLGNNNQKADNGENSLLSLNLTNLTSYSDNQLIAKISTSDTSILITDSLQNISFIGGFDTISLKNAFAIQVKNWVDDGKNVKINLQISDTGNGLWNYIFYLKLYAPKIIVGKMLLDDSSFGDADGVADPGETVLLKVAINNVGSNDASNLLGALIPNSSLLIGNGNPVSVSQLKVDSVFEMSYSFVVNANAKQGDFCRVVYDLTSSGENLSKNYFVVIGNVDEDFETGDFMKFKWVNTGTSNWKIDSINVNHGNYSANSGIISNNAMSGMELTMNVLGDDSIFFNIKISTELGYDFLNFNIDGSPINQWSGAQNWTTVGYPVSAGVHTFSWQYEKDYYASSGLDAVWVDDIRFPLTDILSSIAITENMNSDLLIFPNPSTDQINLVFESLKSDFIEISFLDFTGKLVKKTNITGNYAEGNHSIILDVHDLKKGVYFLVLKTEGAMKANKLIKL